MITKMELEASEVPALLPAQFAANYSLIEELAARLQRKKPVVTVTVARGSSDHAAGFLKYLLETRAGMITSSAAPSVLTVYQKKISYENALVIAISQSGASPDVAEVIKAARENGAMTVAFVNDAHSLLAETAEFVVPIRAGQETAVAATKTYLATLAALIQFVSILTNDQRLLDALMELPNILQLAAQTDWSAAISIYQQHQRTLVIGRGYGYPLAQEAALKFKETAKIQAEAFSSAEVLHGPVALVEKDFPVLLFAQQDETFSQLAEAAVRLKQAGAMVLAASPALRIPEKELLACSSVVLPLPSGIHPVCDPLIIIQAFYMMAARLSVQRGFNPDSPHHLTKVTKTW